MSLFFNRDVDFSGCEVVLKGGTRFNDPEHPRFRKSWINDQVVEIMPLGFYPEDSMVGFCLPVLRFPNISYIGIGGRTQENWKIDPTEMTLWDKVRMCVDENGKYENEFPKGQNHLWRPKRESRDWLIDVKNLLDLKHIDQGEYDQIVNHDRKSIITLGLHSLDDILKHEDEWTRKDPLSLLRHGSIASGDYAIGTGGAGSYDGIYATIVAFEAAIAATQTGSLKAYHYDEETARAANIYFEQDNDGFDFGIYPDPGAEHDASAYGNGARISCSSFTRMRFAGSLGKAELRNIAFDINASSARAIEINGAPSGAGTYIIDGCLIEGSASSKEPISYVETNNGNVVISNNIVYVPGRDGDEIAILVNDEFGGARTFEIYNNTIVGWGTGISNTASTPAGTTTVRNNICQANNDADYDSTNFDTFDKSISEDATGSSEDAGIYQSINLHDATSNFIDYDADGLGIVDSGSESALLDNGVDLSGIFTDDIVGTTRGAWWIGAYEVVVADGAISVSLPMGLTLSGAIKGRAPISCSLGMGLDLSGAIIGKAPISVSLPMGLTLSGNVVNGAGDAISVSLPMGMDLSGSITGRAPISCSIGMGLDISGAITGRAPISVSVPLGLTVSGAIKGKAPLSTSIPMGLDLSGAIIGRAPLSTSISIGLTISGSITGGAPISVSIPMGLTLSGNVSAGGGAISVSLPMGLTLSGNITGRAPISCSLGMGLTLSGIVSTGDVIGEFTAFVFHQGLKIMVKQVIFNFNYPQSVLPLIEVNTESTAEGNITILNDNLDEITSLGGELYLVTAPTSLTESWVTSSGDIYSSARLDLSNKRLRNGNSVVKYRFDPSAISGVAHGQYYGVKILVNQANDATISQAGIDMIMKIVNRISVSA
jgi:hypothetical protein